VYVSNFPVGKRTHSLSLSACDLCYSAVVVVAAGRGGRERDEGEN